MHPELSHSVYQGITPTPASKNTLTSIFCQAPLFRQLPLYIIFMTHLPALKIGEPS